MTSRGIWFTFTITALVVAIQAEISNKRIPSGFQGMRGKKSVDLSNMEEAYYQQNDADRIPYFNSRFSDSPYLDPLQADLLYGYPNNLNLLKRAPMGFQGMRGKKNYLMDTGPLYHETSLTDNIFGVDTFEKRGPMGFQGMRGKREFEYPVLAYPNKRTPMGFQGMRGKKSEPDFSMEYLHTFDDENDKLYQDSFKNDKLFDDGNKNGDSHTNDKSLESVSLEQSNNGLETGVDGMISMKQRRAQNLGFFGVRGKKMPSSASFFGMRGKKGPYDYPFRGKFVGVRGKKLSAGRPSELQMLSDRLSWNDDSFEKRKGPSGFVGMRGKKWIAPEADLSQVESTSNGNGEE